MQSMLSQLATDVEITDMVVLPPFRAASPLGLRSCAVGRVQGPRGDIAMREAGIPR
jgi:hypothetical protein